MPKIRKRYSILIAILVFLPVFLLLLPLLGSYAMVRVLDSNLQVQAQIEDVDLNVFNGRAAIKNLFIEGMYASDLRSSQISADVDMGELLRGNLVAESVRIEGLHLQLQESEDGEMVLLVPLVASGDDGGAETIETPLFSLRQLELLNVSIDVDVKGVKGQFMVDELRLAGLSTLDSQPGKLSLQSNWNKAPLTINGTIAPFDSSPWFEGDVALEEVQLRELNPHLPSELSGLAGSMSMHLKGRVSAEAISLEGDMELMDMVVLMSGLQVHADKLAWQGKAELGEEKQLSLSGNISANRLGVVDDSQNITLVELGALELSELSFNDSPELRVRQIVIGNMRALDRGEEEQRLLYAKDMVLDEFDYRNNQIIIGAIQGDDVVSTVRITAEGELVSQGVLSTSLDAITEASDDDATPAAGDASAEELQWRIDDLTMRNSRLNFFDEQFQKPLRMKLLVDQLTLGQVDSSEPGQASALSLKAGIGDFGRIELDGEFAPLAPTTHTAVNGRIQSLPLPLVSPYIEQLLAYELVAGQFDHDFEIEIVDEHIKASNKLNLRKLKVQAMKGVKAEAPLPVPLDLALNMLRDSDDRIELKVPLEGQLNDPAFGLDHAISVALGKALQAGSTAYLKLALQPYGAIWMGAEMGLKLAGKTRLDPMRFAPLQQEPGTEQQDYTGKLATILTERPAVQLQLCGEAGKDDFEALVLSARPQASASEPAVDSEPEAAANIAPTPEQMHQMQELAEARALSVKQWMVRERGIGAERLYLCKPKANPEGDLSGIRMSM